MAHPPISPASSWARSSCPATCATVLPGTAAAVPLPSHSATSSERVSSSTALMPAGGDGFVRKMEGCIQASTEVCKVLVATKKTDVSHNVLCLTQQM